MPMLAEIQFDSLILLGYIVCRILLGMRSIHHITIHRTPYLQAAMETGSKLLDTIYSCHPQFSSVSVSGNARNVMERTRLASMKLGERPVDRVVTMRNGLARGTTQDRNWTPEATISATARHPAEIRRTASAGNETDL